MFSPDRAIIFWHADWVASKVCAVFAEGFGDVKRRDVDVDSKGAIAPPGISQASSSTGEVFPRTKLVEQVRLTGFVCDSKKVHGDEVHLSGADWICPGCGGLQCPWSNMEFLAQALGCSILA
jgi:hypothetical protein